MPRIALQHQHTGRIIQTAFLTVATWLACAFPASGQTGTLHGAVIDSATGAPLSGVHVTAIGAANVIAATALTDGRGRFRLNGLAAASYTLVIRRVGYAVRSIDGVVPAVLGTSLEIALTPREVVLDPVQITASRAPETTLDAPVSVSVVSRRDIAEAAAFTPLEHVRAVAGMDFFTKGLVQHQFAVRSFLMPSVPLLVVDYRNAALPSLGINIPYLLHLTNEDLERIEVVRGPGAALYGPDTHHGVVHIVSRSPFESQGAALSLAGGGRSVLQATTRFAVAPSRRLAFKVSGDYFQGDDWEHSDSMEVRNRRRAILNGADPDTLLIGRRDFRIGRAVGEARVDWRPDSATSVIGSLGAAQAINVIDLAGGGVQVRDWRYSFAQARLHRRRLFVNVTYNLSDAGRTYFLRTGRPIVDNSRQVAAQVQHGVDTRGVALLYGLDGEWTDPRTGGTIHGENEDDDLVGEIGGYVQARTAMSPQFDLVTAIRVDRNNRLNDLSVSPRAGVVFRPAAAHTLRLTYNRAFSSPDPGQLFRDFVTQTVAFRNVVFLDLRNASVPIGGYSFRRDCPGLCMRSPFDTAGQPLPADATVVWDSVVAALGLDLSDVPGPIGSNVATNLGARNPFTGRFDPVSEAEVTDIAARRRAIVEAVELGYKGVLGARTIVAVDAYVNHVQDALGGPFAATPNVFYDSTTLARYLVNFRPANVADSLAGLIAAVPVGTVSPQETSHPLDVLVLQRQGGSYTVWGVEASLTATLTSRLTVSGTYSWMSRNVIPDVPVVGTVVLNAAENKGAVTLHYRAERIGLTAALQGRAVGMFFAVRGAAALRDTIQSYAVVDARVGYEPRWAPGISISLDARNVLDHRHRELVGAPQLGRLVVSRVQARF